MADARSNPIRRGVVGVALRDSRMLVIRRSQLVTAPGQICFPGGGIEAGEDEPTALVREFREELGAEVSPLRRLWRSTTPWQVELAWWLVDMSAGVRLVANPAEVAEYSWHTAEEMDALTDLLESNRQFLAALAAGEFSLEC